MDEKALKVKVSDIEDLVFMIIKSYLKENVEIKLSTFDTLLGIVQELGRIEIPLKQGKILKRAARIWNTFKDECDSSGYENNYPKHMFKINQINKRFSELTYETSVYYENLSDFDASSTDEKIREIRNIENRDVFDLTGTEELIKLLAYFEYVNINSKFAELEDCKESWDWILEHYSEENILVKETLLIIKEMFDEIIAEDLDFMDQITIDESELQELENKVKQFDDEVSKVFFEEKKEMYKLQFNMEDGNDAFKLVNPINSQGGNIISYISEGKYYNQNRKPIEFNKIQPINIKFDDTEISWRETNRWGDSENKQGKICFTDIKPEIMNDTSSAFELDKEEEIRIETNEPRNIKYISLEKKLYDRKKDSLYINQSHFHDVYILNNDEVFIKYDDEEYNFPLAKKSSSSTMNRKEMDAHEWNTQKNIIEQKYQTLENQITGNIAKLENKPESEEYNRLKALLKKLEDTQKRYLN